MTGRTYASPAAMRTALEQRLRDRHRTSKLPLDRLRKEVALQRLLARICAAAPAGSWALKGGIAMIARLGERARTTADADATWRADREQLRDMLDRACAQDLGDHFEFTIGQGRRIEGEGPDNGLRFPVTARLASRIFEQIRLDVNIMTEDPRPIEDVTLRNLLDFADIPSVTVPAIKLDQQLAEKLHAYTRDYGRQENGRAKDLYDMLVIAQELPLPVEAELAGACRQTFALRQTAWPPTLGPPPESWAGTWRTYITDYGIQLKTLASAYSALRTFWEPIFAEQGPDRTWNADSWTWS
jgi:predicted nucleotidyltransferase component of viral defense system